MTRGTTAHAQNRALVRATLHAIIAMNNRNEEYNEDSVLNPKKRSGML